MTVTRTPAEVINLGVGDAPSSITVTTTSTQILAFNSARNWCILTNIGNKDIYMAAGQTAIVNNGIFLSKGGGTFEMTSGVMFINGLNGITASGSSVIVFQEGN